MCKDVVDEGVDGIARTFDVDLKTLGVAHVPYGPSDGVAGRDLQHRIAEPDCLDAALEDNDLALHALPTARTTVAAMIAAAA